MPNNNFNLRTRDLTKAGKFALRHFCNKKGISFSTVRTDALRWGQFACFARSQGVKWMEDISIDLVHRYGKELADLAMDEEVTPAYAQNCLSVVNTVMGIATYGRWASISPIGCGIPKRSHLLLEVPTGMNREDVARAVAALRCAELMRASCIADLAREFGLRLKEDRKSVV